MITSIMLWNEPNNLSHWDFQMDPEWRQFSTMTRTAARAVKESAPDLPLVLGGISPIDPNFIRLLAGYGTLENLDAVGVHGFPLDWNHWRINDWPNKIKEIEDVSPLPVWVTEVGASSFGADEVQVFGIQRMNQLLIGRVAHIFWYSLLDVTLTFCFTPPSLGRRACHTSPPVDLEEFARFATEMVRRYVLRETPGRTAGPERPAGVVASNRGGERNHYEQNQDRNRRTRQLCEQPAPGH